MTVTELSSLALSIGNIVIVMELDKELPPDLQIREDQEEEDKILRLKGISLTETSHTGIKIEVRFYGPEPHRYYRHQGDYIGRERPATEGEGYAGTL